jgi:hypothetical protein
MSKVQQPAFSRLIALYFHVYICEGDETYDRLGLPKL